MQNSFFYLATLLMALPGFSASADTSISTLPDTGTVTVQGAVDKVESDREFILRDSSGTIEVYVTSGQQLVLTPGEKVGVTGVMHKSLFGVDGKRIDASDVEVRKNLKSAIADTITEATGISLDKAKTVQINEIPDQGMVKLTGSIESVRGAKNFTLKDSTGAINVAIISNENVILTKGSEVTVIGNVDKGMFSKSIQASHVAVSDNALPTAGGG